MDALLATFAVVFVAELGDKSQLLTLTFAARYRALRVLVGLVIATGILMGLSVGVGAAIGSALPGRALEIAGGLAFLGFAAWTLWGPEEHEEADVERGGRSAVLTVAVAFALAELGDKTMLATITLASRQPALATWLGATTGMVAANALALLVGDRLGRYVSERTVTRLSAALFAVFGVLLLLGIF